MNLQQINGIESFNSEPTFYLSFSNFFIKEAQRSRLKAFYWPHLFQNFNSTKKIQNPWFLKSVPGKKTKGSQRQPSLDQRKTSVLLLRNQLCKLEDEWMAWAREFCGGKQEASPFSPLLFHTFPLFVKKLMSDMGHEKEEL